MKIFTKITQFYEFIDAQFLGYLVLSICWVSGIQIPISKDIQIIQILDNLSIWVWVWVGLIYVQTHTQNPTFWGVKLCSGQKFFLFILMYSYLLFLLILIYSYIFFLLILIYSYCEVPNYSF